jgi:hypothetical protein
MVKTVRGNKYNWCKYHQAWTIHAEKDCTLGKNEDQSKTPKNENEEKGKSGKDSLVLAKAYCSIVHSDDKEE